MKINHIDEDEFFCPNCNNRLKRIPPLNIQLELDKATEALAEKDKEIAGLKDDLKAALKDLNSRGACEGEWFVKWKEQIALLKERAETAEALVLNHEGHIEKLDRQIATLKDEIDHTAHRGQNMDLT